MTLLGAISARFVFWSQQWEGWVTKMLKIYFADSAKINKKITLREEIVAELHSKGIRFERWQVDQTIHNDSTQY